MARFPKAIWRGPIPATNYSPGPTAKIGVCHHVIVGGSESAINEFHASGAQLSAHFVVAGIADRDPDGTIIQLLDTDAISYAQMQGNTAYISVETSGQPSTPMTAAQCEALAQIDAWASITHNFPLNGPVAHGTPGITAHCNPDGTADPTWGNHSCPGPLRLAQIPGVVARARALAIPVPPPPPPAVHTQGVKMLARTPDGKGYWIIKPDGSVWGYGTAGYHGGLNTGAPVGGGAMKGDSEADPEMMGGVGGGCLVTA